MRSKRGKALVALLAICAYVFNPAVRLLAAPASEASTPAGYARSVEMRPGELTGKLLYSDGKTPVTKAPVRVWSVENKGLVLEVLTDEKGAYSLGKLEEGRYLIVFGDRVTVKLRVAKDAKDGVSTLDVIVPHGQVAFAQMAQQQRTVVLAALTLVGATEEEGDGEGGGGGGTGGGGGLRGTAVIGTAGALIAVAVIDIFDLFEDEDKKVVSP